MQNMSLPILILQRIIILNALKTFEKLITDYPKCVYVKRSMLKIGLIERNMNDDKLALATFKKVVTTIS